MCQSAAAQKPSASSIAQPSLMKVLFQGSRRAKLWELTEMFHCPVIGVCLSTKAIQRLITQVSAKPVLLTEYESHSIAVNACQQRGPLSERLQKELDAKHNLAIQQCRSLETPDALLTAWKIAVSNGNIAGCFWALITHPRTTAAVRETIYRDVHMIQHQAGASIRVDLEAFNALGRENATLLKEMGKIQHRMSDFSKEKSIQIDQLSAELLRRDQGIATLKAQLNARDTEIRQLSRATELLQQNLALQATVERLSCKLAVQAAEMAELRTAPLHSKTSMAMAGYPANEQDDAASMNTPAGLIECDRDEARLHQKTVFVVGGRRGNFSEYRSTIEETGARFLFHDGGIEHSMQTLESGLQAADYVICQTGCISHASYWKVKEFCKRTGKRCVYVDRPGTSSLRQSIGEL